jgi:hypothetical protein
VTRTTVVCIVLILFCPRANAQTTPTVLTAPFICEWANIQGGCPGMGWQAGFPTPSSPVDANCGPTSVLMIASKYSGTTPSTDQISLIDTWLQSMFGTSWVYMANNGKGSGTETPELTSLARNFFGLSNSTAFSGWTLDQLKQELAQGYPVIVRVSPQMVVNKADAHYMVLLGMDDQWVYVNDPGIRKGEHAKYKLQNFIDSWKQTALWDGKDNEGLTIHPYAPSQVSFSRTDYQVGLPGSVMLDMVADDFNRDGIIDLAIANLTKSSVTVLLGKGDGSFGSGIDVGVAQSPIALATGDFNGDGNTDLAVGTATIGNVLMLPGNGNGSFGTATSTLTGVSGNINAVLVADFNGDGKLDLATAQPDSSTITVLLGRGSGAFGVSQPLSGGTSSASLASGDFNGDGKLDIATSFPALSSTNIQPAVSVLFGNGNGTFQDRVDYPGVTKSGTYSVALGDLNGDGKLDLVLNSGVDSAAVVVLLGNGNGTFANAKGFGIGQGAEGVPHGIVIGDFNGDGKLDVLALTGGQNNGPHSIIFLAGNGDGSFGGQQGFDLPANSSFGYAIVAGDFNRDGKLDFAVTNFANGMVSVFLNTSQ